MDYNQKLNKLMEDAKAHGYKFENGKFFKDSKDFFPVMEVMFEWHTTYEDEGQYYIYKHTFEINQENYKKMIDFIQSQNLKEYNLDKEETVYDVIEEIVFKYLNTDHTCDAFGNCNYNGNITFAYDTFQKYGEKDECGDIWFVPPFTQSTFPFGYVSFYQMRKEDFAKQENVNLILEKFMKYN